MKKWFIWLTIITIVSPIVPKSVHADEEVLWQRNFDNEQEGDITSQLVFFANGSRTPTGDNGRASSTWFVVSEPDNPNGKALQNIGGNQDNHDSWYFADTVNNTATNQGQYTGVQCDIWIPATANGDDSFRVGLFGYIDSAQNDSYGAWFKWSERKVRVGKLEAGQETNTKSDEFAAAGDTEQWYTLRCDYKDLGGGQLEVTSTIYPRSNPSAALSAKNVVVYEAQNTFAIGLYMYSNSKENKIWDNFKAFRPAAKQNVIWSQDFNSLALNTDYTDQVKFFSEGSNDKTGDNGRASSTWMIAADPLDPNNKVLQNMGGAVDSHDSWYFVETVNNPAVNKGSYNILQADVFIPDIAQADDLYRVGLFGLIDPNQNDSYGAWFKWTERKLRVGKLESGQETNVKSEEFAGVADTNRWYTLRLAYKNLGAGQLEVTATIFPKTDPAKATSAKNVVVYEAQKTFAIGMYLISNSREDKMWDNFQALEEIRPQANAGISFRAVVGAQNVKLDGSKSVGAVTYQWEVIPYEHIINPTQATEASAGPTEIDPNQSIPAIRNADQAVAYFDVPGKINAGAERIQFKLTINAGTEDESDATVFVYLEEFGGALATRDGFAPPASGWDYAWDGDVSPLSSLGLFRKNFSFDYDIGAHGQSDPVPPAGWAEDWSQNTNITTLHTESGLIVCRWSGNTVGTFIDLADVFTDLGSAGIFDETGATMLIRAKNSDLQRDDGNVFNVFPYPFDSRTGAISTIDDTVLAPGGTRVGFGSKVQDTEAVISYGSLDDQLFILKGDSEDEYESGVKVPDVNAMEFSTIWINVNTQNGQKTVTVYTKPDSGPIFSEVVTRPARRADPFDLASGIDPNISNNYFRLDLERDAMGYGYNNALCIDFICLKRGTFKPTSVFAGVNSWMLY